MSTIPASVDCIVIGSGPSGSACAAELANVARVLVLEAGPDYGPANSGRWPADLLEAFDLAESHSWGYDSGTTYPERVVPFSRARVLGGCSSHNGCAAIWGHRLDYDSWAAAGNPGWATDDLRPLFHAVNQAMRVRQPGPTEITPFHQAMLDAAAVIGIPMVADLNDLDDPLGMAASPVNIWHGMRWNAGFAFLDPIRDRPNVTVLGDAFVTRLLFEGTRVSGVEVVINGTVTRISAGTVVIAGGTYNSPALLLQSGIGPADELGALDIQPRLDLPGVGRNLHDHPAVYVQFSGSERLFAEMIAWSQTAWLPEEQTIAKLRSNQPEPAFDLHIYPECGPYANGRTAWDVTIPVACMTPHARGSVRLTKSVPGAPLAIDHNYLGDPEGHDLAVLVDGVRIALELAATVNGDGLLGDLLEDGPQGDDDATLRTWIARHVHHYFHAAGTCKMGPASDPMAVVAHTGEVHGLSGVYVADCAIMPQVPRANTNIPAAVVGMRIGAGLSGRL